MVPYPFPKHYELPYTAAEIDSWLDEIRVNNPNISDEEITLAVNELRSQDGEQRAFFRALRDEMSGITYGWNSDTKTLTFRGLKLTEKGKKWAGI